MLFDTQRLKRERETVQAMIRLYCRDHHPITAALCPECQQLSDYALLRLEKCPYQAEKPTCNQCPVHCYQPEKRTRMREVMRYAGPHMLTHHPLLALFHLLDGLTSKPGKIRPR
jgi:hypothetical protein